MGIFKNLFSKKDNIDAEIQSDSNSQNENNLVNNQFSFADREFGEITTKILEEGNEFSGHVIEMLWGDNTFKTWATVNIDSSITINEIVNDEDGIIKLIKQIKEFNQKDFITKVTKLMVEQNYNLLNLSFVCLSKEALIEEIMNNHYLEILDYSEYFSNHKFNITKCSYRFLIKKNKIDVYWMYDLVKNEITDFKIDNYD